MAPAIMFLRWGPQGSVSGILINAITIYSCPSQIRTVPHDGVDGDGWRGASYHSYHRAPRLDQSIFLSVIDIVIVIAIVVVMIFCVGVFMSLQATLTHGLPSPPLSLSSSSSSASSPITRPRACGASLIGERWQSQPCVLPVQSL